MTTDSGKLREYYDSLTDEELARLQRLGPGGFAEGVWQVIDEIVRARATAPPRSVNNITEPGRMTVDADPKRRADRRACVSLLVLGIISLLLFGPMQCAIVRQNEGLGMAVAFLIIPLAIPFAIALICAVVLSGLGLNNGSRAFPKCLLIWCAAAAVFIGQMVMLNGIAGGDRFRGTTVVLYSVVGFGSLLLVVLTPWWWLFAMPVRRP